MSRSRSRLLALFSTTALIAGLVPAVSAAQPAPPPASRPSTDKAIFFGSDGMRQDLMEGFAAAGHMPTYKAVMDAGVKGANGLRQAFPPNTGVGWYTLASGTWPGEHGSTNNTFHRTGESNFNNRTSLGASILQADTIQQAAERVLGGEGDDLHVRLLLLRREVLVRDHGAAVKFWRKSYLGIPSPFASEMRGECDAVINGVGH